MTQESPAEPQTIPDKAMRAKMNPEEPRRTQMSPGEPKPGKDSQTIPEEPGRPQKSPGEPLDNNGSRAGVTVKCLWTQVAAVFA